MNEQLSEIVERWDQTEYLKDLSQKDKNILAIILENERLICEVSDEEVIDKNQMIWLTQQGWLRAKFRKMINVQPLTRPYGLAYYANSGFIERQAVATQTLELGCKIFNKAPFEQIKDIYANAIAYEIDMEILQHLPQVEIDFLIESTIPLNEIYDYIIAPQEIIDYISKYQKIDLFVIPKIMNKEFSLIAAAGKYPSAILESPIYMPYTFLNIGASNASSTRSLYNRSGWLDTKK